jgi:hypothetical protein
VYGGKDMVSGIRSLPEKTKWANNFDWEDEEVDEFEYSNSEKSEKEEHHEEKEEEKHEETHHER